MMWLNLGIPYTYLCVLTRDSVALAYIARGVGPGVFKTHYSCMHEQVNGTENSTYVELLHNYLSGSVYMYGYMYMYM